MITRRALLSSSAAAFAAPSHLFAQQTYPSRAIQMIVPFAAGGSTDTLARPLAEEMGKALGGSIVIENRGGGGGSAAIDLVARAVPDGHTVLLGSIGPLTVTQFLTKSWKTDPGAALTAIGMIADAPLVVVTGRKRGITSLKQLIEIARQSPDAITYASASIGSSNHLGAILLEKATGIKTRHVPYRGAAPAIADLVAGHVDYMIAAVPSARGLIESGDLVALGVTGDKRAALFPNVPTSLEAGVDGFTITTWYGLCAPIGLPSEISARIATALETAMRDATLQQRIKDEGAVPSTLRGEDFARFMQGERKRWGALIAEAGIDL